MFMSSAGKLRLQNREKKIMAYYDDMGPGKGNCTVGYGSLVHRNPCTPDELKTPVTQEMVSNLFSANVRDAEKAVERNVRVPLTQAQFDALVSYTFNRGATGARSVYRLINRGEFHEAGLEMRNSTMVKVRKKGKLVPVIARGLIDRRTEESAPFLAAPTQKAGSTVQ
ncbi:lysozyme [Massilia sp. ST3]|uniref:lysozyme n=1 Tax=Massilia sp. ST3 TaxID=2824903 RepID=UPI001B836542|nr:lysozyme [Massilia sp. ST3]MBQ5949064.1 lysozyme [Massilia sp. ST3]